MWLAYHRGKTFGIRRYVGPLVSPGAFVLPLLALAAVDEVDSGWLDLLLIRLLVVVLDGVDRGPRALAAPVGECMLECFIALPRQVFEALFLVEPVFYFLRPHLGWEFHDEDVLEDRQVYVVVRREQALETVGESGRLLALARG